MSTHTERTPIVVTHDGGVKFSAQLRTHRVVVDQQIRGGGDDAGPSPVEMLGVALGTCVAFYVQQFCHARHLPYEGLRVEVEQHGATNPSRVGQFVVRVLLAHAVPESYAALLERVAQSCPAHNTLTQGAVISVVIESPAVV